MTDKQRLASPEWVVATREDALVDERYGQGWGVSSERAAPGPIEAEAGQTHAVTG